jgi:ketosteroid isomerase-like protein
METQTTRALLLIATCALCAPLARAENARDIAARAFAQWQTQFNARDFAALSAGYCEDAVVLPPTDTSVAGRSAIRAMLEASRAEVLEHNGADLLAVHATGDTVYASGVWSATALVDGRAQLVGGNVVHVLEQQDDGTWKTRLQIWN